LRPGCPLPCHILIASIVSYIGDTFFLVFFALNPKRLCFSPEAGEKTFLEFFSHSFRHFSTNPHPPLFLVSFLDLFSISPESPHPYSSLNNPLDPPYNSRDGNFLDRACQPFILYPVRSLSLTYYEANLCAPIGSMACGANSDSALSLLACCQQKSFHTLAVDRV